MASYKIVFRQSVEKDLRKINKSQVPKIIEAVKGLETEPRPLASRKLVGSEHTYRSRIGEYRVIYQVLDESKLVEVERIRHRKDVYR